jgi:hypothetical protein
MCAAMSFGPVSVPKECLLSVTFHIHLHSLLDLPLHLFLKRGNCSLEAVLCTSKKGKVYPYNRLLGLEGEVEV